MATASPTAGKPFKLWFDQAAARRLADQVAAVWPAFDREHYVRTATRGLNALEFQARVQQFADALVFTLPTDIPEALDILTRSLPPARPDTRAVNDGWLQWPVGQFIADHGGAHFEASMHAMTELTMRFSSEFAVRPFLEHRPQETFAQLYRLTRHPNPHVRRWCSEGARPRLPWGRRLTALVRDPTPCWPLLEALKDDPEPYVRKSVANHLNDIAKDHPDLVIARCRVWQVGATAGRLWIIRHALRSLIKAGHPEALAVLGFSRDAGVTATLAARPRRIPMGSAAELTAVLRNPGPVAVRVVVDYIVHYVRPSGRASAKVFKWTVVTLAPQATIRLVKNHPFRPVSIRALHPGKHRIDIQVNGQRLHATTVTLLA